jgi:hypothetical protein
MSWPRPALTVIEKPANQTSRICKLPFLAPILTQLGKKRIRDCHSLNVQLNSLGEYNRILLKIRGAVCQFTYFCRIEKGNHGDQARLYIRCQ